MTTTSRINREKKIIQTMIGMFCRDRHESGGELCRECRELLDYAVKRLDQCPYKDQKPTCASCTVHCYKPVMRERVREAMRYSGPRMTYRHPVMAFHHLRDGRLKPKGDIKK